ncbi:MAG: hypothetical protein CVU79_00710 [Elusimicrobia bacterium HGW-Elusimicrobia-3]|jgi:hypothetical protein|nr:MAG: hypothetical protein CVU79_00710 [Elusimicrobia bacterium HGW-Elusimicrobia-3]
MMKFQPKKNKSTQYVIGGTVAVIILGIWVSIPLMSGSSLDSRVSAGNPFRSKVADIGLLGSDIASEAGAPGSPLSGEMINNPATSGEDIASSLFQSGPGVEEPEAVTAEASVSADAPAPSASGAAPAPAAPRGKLAAAASITGGNSNSMTAGGTHNKFFGTGNNKAELASVSAADLGKSASVEKRNTLVALLGNSANKSQSALKTGADLGAAKGGAAQAFANTSKTSSTDLNSNLEEQTALSGLQMGQTAQDLKKNDPSISKTKVTPPSKPEDATDESEEMKNQIKMMVIQMVLKMALGAVFQGMMPA